MTPLSPAERAALSNLSYSWRHYTDERHNPNPSALVRDLLPAALIETPRAEAKEAREDETSN